MTLARPRPSRRPLLDLIERDFPGLALAPCAPTSRPTSRYNCVAWALGLTDRFVWFDEAWPEGVPTDDAVPSLVALFERAGYAVCRSAARDARADKVAIYATRDGLPQHVARQLPGGRWTSKLGRMHDIEHDLGQLEGRAYGRVAVVMRRAKRRHER